MKCNYDPILLLFRNKVVSLIKSVSMRIFCQFKETGNFIIFQLIFFFDSAFFFLSKPTTHGDYKYIKEQKI